MKSKGKYHLTEVLVFRIFVQPLGHVLNRIPGSLLRHLTQAPCQTVAQRLLKVGCIHCFCFYVELFYLKENNLTAF